MRGELLEAELVRSIVGAFYEVNNYFGYGLSERIYCERSRMSYATGATALFGN